MVQAIIPTGYSATQAEIDSGIFDSKSGGTIQVVDGAGQLTGEQYDVGPAGNTPTQVVTGGNINTVLAAAGGAGWEKAQATTANYAITKPASGASLDLHIETGGTLAAMLAANWPVPASGVDQLRIRNMSAVAQTFSATGFSGIVTADGNAATSGTYSIPVDVAVHITIDEDGWIQVAPMGQEVSQAELDAVVSSLTNGSVQALFDTMRADACTFMAAATDINTLTGTGWYNIQNATNGPAGGGWYYFFNGVHRSAATGAPSTVYGFQLAKRLDLAGTNNLLMRVQTAGTWTAWATLATIDVATTTVAGLMSAADKTKLDGVASGAEVNVQSDWNAASGDALILNKPTIPASITVNNTLTSTSTTEALSAAQGKALQDGKADASHAHAADATKQDLLVSGANIKTVNGTSLVGAGNITIAGDLPGGSVQTALDDGLDSGSATIDRTTVAGQTILKYTTVGSSTFKVPVGVTEAQVLVVAGGGGGGSGVGGDLRGGGGGAGGLISNAAFAVIPGASLTVTVGAGGAAAVTGSDSVFSTLTADGGGRGGSGAQTGFAGGSGGGGGANSGGANSFAGGAGTAGEGNDGGTGGSDGTTYRNGGGGGGASAAGAAGSASGAGGAGTASTITGASVTYGGGGGGGGPAAANGGAGGGGRGGAYPAGAATAGSPNTGGGGGGGANTVAGAAGGSGLVVVRFTTQTRTYTAMQIFADNAAALAGGLLVGQFYKKTADGSLQQVV